MILVLVGRYHLRLDFLRPKLDFAEDQLVRQVSPLLLGCRLAQDIALHLGYASVAGPHLLIVQNRFRLVILPASMRLHSSDGGVGDSIGKVVPEQRNVICGKKRYITIS